MHIGLEVATAITLSLTGVANLIFETLEYRFHKSNFDELGARNRLRAIASWSFIVLLGILRVVAILSLYFQR